MKPKNGSWYTVNEAAAILGRSPDFIRIRMAAGLLPIGRVVPPVRKNGRTSYMIFPDMLERYMGKEKNNE